MSREDELQKKHEKARLEGSDEHLTRIKGASGAMFDAIESYAQKNELSEEQEHVYKALQKMAVGGFGVNSAGGATLRGADMEGTGTFSTDISEEGKIDVVYTDFSTQPAREKKASYETGIPLGEMFESAPETHGQILGQLLLEYSELVLPEEQRKLQDYALRIAQDPSLAVGGGFSSASGKKRILAVDDSGRKYVQVDFQPEGITVKTENETEKFRYRPAK